MAQASPSWQRLIGLLSVLLALFLGLSTENHGAAAAGCPAEIASASENTWSVDFDNRTDVSETHSESSYVESLKEEFAMLEATGLHGTGARSGFDDGDSTVKIPASCLNGPNKNNNNNKAPLELPVSLAGLHLRTVQTWASYM
ncbi:hypothetical protein CkaCkLH20_08167 [Colletotrichum karsti]|uniref:Uncharacterized protein n=1 Tax=Colletotrichum karsti TaxID=1095194 RepID=A0A9P6LFI5_9PEZI|nr:uncharacterized protein CkaCkLH20_08167 [Colletotrichum karsti]KAF9874184.1 hypothetical protein CkaCkLH20_08167 [Colletotrichum karsti]